MDKQKFNFDETKELVYVFNNQPVRIVPYLSLDEQQTLIHSYISDYFREGKTLGESVLYAEGLLMLNILDLKTDILMFEDGKPILTMDMIFSNIDLFYEVVSRIKNYLMFRELLTKAIEEHKYQETVRKSIGNVVEESVSKILAFVDELAQYEPTEQNIAKIKQLFHDVSSDPFVKEAVTIFRKDAPVPVETKASSRKKRT